MFKPGEKLVSLMNHHSYDDLDIEYEQIYIFKRYYGTPINDSENLIYLKGYNNIYYEVDFVSLKEYRKQKLEKICSSQAII